MPPPARSTRCARRAAREHPRAGGGRASPRARRPRLAAPIRGAPRGRPRCAAAPRARRGACAARARPRRDRALPRGHRSTPRSTRDAGGMSSSRGPAGKAARPRGSASPRRAGRGFPSSNLRRERQGPSRGDPGGSPSRLSMPRARSACGAVTRRSGSAWPSAEGYFMDGVSSLTTALAPAPRTAPANRHSAGQS
jgi:hypothetical protein